MIPTRSSVALMAALTLVVSCGGGSDGASTDATPSTEASATSDAIQEAPTATDAAPDTDAADAAPGGAEDYEPGEIEFRVVNVLDVPVDIYTRTTGLVEAYLIEEGVAPGAVTDFVAPPAEGAYLVTQAGAGDPTCVSTCDHFITQLSAYPDEGPAHTVVLYNDEAGKASAFDLWEAPDVSREGNANAMVAADPGAGTVVVTAIAVTDADFGLRLAEAGVPGCLEPHNLTNILVGGNQTPAFLYETGSIDLVLHDNQDRECASEPVGGPFTIDGGSGTRSHLILTGSPGAMEAVVVPMFDAPSAGSGSTDDQTAGAEVGDRSLAIELMTVEVATEFGLDPDQAECAATLLVDALTPAVLLDGGALVDLDALGDEFVEPASAALANAITDCGIDPSALGG